MRIFGLLGLVVALVIVGLLAKKQLSAVGSMQVSTPQTTTTEQGVTIKPEGATVREQSRSLQQQIKQAVDVEVQTGAARGVEQADK